MGFIEQLRDLTNETKISAVTTARSAAANVVSSGSAADGVPTGGAGSITIPITVDGQVETGHTDLWDIAGDKWDDPTGVWA